MTIRATAIAAARPALRASPPPRGLDGSVIPSESTLNPQLVLAGLAPAPMLGLYPFALKLDFWISAVHQGLSVGGQPMPFTFHHQYHLRVADDGQQILDESDQVVGTFAEFGTSVGQAVQPVGTTAIAASQVNGYVAIYDAVPGPNGTVLRVIGYGFCDAKNENSTQNNIRFSSGIKEGLLSESSGVHVWVAANGVSARLDSSAPNLSGEEWDYVIARNHYLAYGPCEANLTGDVSYDYHALRWGTLLAATLAR
jgi:hypothetical protein